MDQDSGPSIPDKASRSLTALEGVSASDLRSLSIHSDSTLPKLLRYA